MIAVLIAVYRPRLAELAATLDALLEARAAGVPLALHLWHNDGGPDHTDGLQAAYDRAAAAGLEVKRRGGQGNLGFGAAINALAASAQAPFLLVLNQDAIPEPGALARLWQTARDDADDVAAWEMRQIPYEHPKDYDPVTLETGWCSGAAVLLRAEAFRAQGGFEPRIFMYCEDVDLSWRLRCDGWRLRYLPPCAVVHHTYAVAGEIKPLQALGSAYANLCLRTRFGAATHVKDTLVMLLGALRRAEPFEGYHRGLLKALLKFARNAAYFRRTRRAGPNFQPCFNGMDYEARREGSFHPFHAAAEQVQPRPWVTLLVATAGRPEALQRLLHALVHQTHRPLEVIVVGGGAAARGLPRAVADALEVRAVPEASLAQLLAQSRGRWIGVVDDESSLPYADHVEVLLQAAQDGPGTGALALAWPIDAYFGAEPVANRFHAACGSAAPAASEPTLALLERARLGERAGGALAPSSWRAAWADIVRGLGDDGLARVHKTTSIVRRRAEPGQP